MRKVLHSIFTEFGIPMKLVWLIKMFKQNLKFHIGKNVSDAFSIQNGLEQDTLPPLL
jgi:hypothetical protein